MDVHMAYWINKTMDTHSEYVILIAFPQQQWLCKSTSMLCLYVHFPSCFSFLRK